MMAGKLRKAKAAKKQTPREHILTLRSALFGEGGCDKDVLADFGAFAAFKRNDLDHTLHFAAKLPRKLVAFACDLTQRNMAETYSEMGLSWNNDDLVSELKEQSNRFIVVRQAAPEGEEGKPVGYVHFRFSMDGELRGEMSGAPALWVFNFQLEPALQRKGLGRHIMSLLELIARKHSMQSIQVMILAGDERGEKFLTAKLKGFEEDESALPEQDEGDETVYRKSLLPKPKAAA